MGIIGSATDAIITVDETQTVTLFNAAAEKMFRCPADQAIGRPLGQFIPRAIPLDPWRAHPRVWRDGNHRKRHGRADHPDCLASDGVEFPIESTVSQVVVGRERASPPSFATSASARAREAAVRASEGRYRTLFEYAPDGIVIADPRSYYIDANPSICRMLGYTRDELIGMHASRIVVESEFQHIGAARDTIHAGSEYNREWQFRRKDGSVFAAEVIATLMPDGNLMGMIRDISGGARRRPLTGERRTPAGDRRHCR